MSCSCVSDSEHCIIYVNVLLTADGIIPFQRTRATCRSVMITKLEIITTKETSGHRSTLAAN